MPAQSYQGGWVGCCGPASFSHKINFDLTEAKWLYNEMDYNTCDVAVCLILGGSMSMLHAGGYYIKASINYLAASYDIALGGQND